MQTGRFWLVAIAIKTEKVVGNVSDIYDVMSKAFCYLILVGKIDLGSVRLNFWDLGGQEELQSLWDKVCTHSTSGLGGIK